VSIHTVTAFLYSGLAARPYWFTAMLAPRFLASAFAAGPALLILLCFIVRRTTRYDPGDTAIRKLAQIVTYAMVINVLLFGVELFTSLYSGMHHHIIHFQYLFWSVDGQVAPVVPFMWLSMLMTLISLALLIPSKTRNDFRLLVPACAMVFVAIWLDKGAGMMTGGMIPSPLGTITPYFPSLVEIVMGIGLYAFGALVLTLLYKIAVTIKEETA
jgi:molybdopterin-containing oxidoreductase family membrane subunit